MPPGLTDVLNWVIPTFLGFIIVYLRKISETLTQLGQNLAVVTERSNSHERRIGRIEERMDDD